MKGWKYILSNLKVNVPFVFRVYQNSPSEHKITNVGSQNCHITLWKENLPDTGNMANNLFQILIHDIFIIFNLY